MGKTAIYPGTFDPVTYGHIDVIKRASQVFDHIVVAVAFNTQKKPLFDNQERLDFIQQAVKDIPNVSVELFHGLVINYAREKNVNVLIRGLRMISDFEYELQMALTNRRLATDIETVFLMPSEGYSFISSTLLKEAASLGADVSSFVPAEVCRRLKERLMEVSQKH